MLQRFKRSYQPLNIITISKDNLLQNYHYLSSINKRMQVAPVLKSNAYGHGLTIVAKQLDKVHAPFFCVDSLYEGYELIKAGINTPILIMGYVHPKSLQTKKLPFMFVVSQREQVVSIAKFQRHAKVHIFVDTGMHREGVRIEELSDFIRYVKLHNLPIEGLMSHFAMADNPDHPLTKQQVALFRKAQEILKQAGIRPKWIHMAASSALLHYEKLGQDLGNIARVGRVLYGIDETNKRIKPVLEFSTTLAQIKQLRKGESVGYDFTFTAKKDMKIGILPIGYADGVEIRLSNTGYVSIDGILCPIIGRVSMNIMTIDISKVTNAKIGQQVLVYSKKTNIKNSLRKSVELCKTISYELLIRFASSTKRFIV